MDPIFFTFINIFIDCFSFVFFFFFFFLFFGGIGCRRGLLLFRGHGRSNTLLVDNILMPVNRTQSTELSLFISNFFLPLGKIEGFFSFFSHNLW